MINKLKIIVKKKWNLLDILYAIVSIINNKLQYYMNYVGKYELILDNKKWYENLLIILTWYDSFLDEKVFERVHKYLDDNIDVCVLTPWKKCNNILDYCKKFGRSYLYTKQNKLSFGQNIIIKLHEKAKYIYKIDGDIFITKGFFKNLKNKYNLALKNSEFIPSAVAPVININWRTYSYFLDVIWKKDDFIAKFKELKQSVCDKWENIWYSWDVAKYIRKCTFNIDDKQEKFFNDIDITKNFLTNPIRFSIWCFMFTREHWKNLDGKGFKQWYPWAMWVEEVQFLGYSLYKSRPIILCENQLVWHFCFWPQKQQMKEFFEQNKNLF